VVLEGVGGWFVLKKTKQHTLIELSLMELSTPLGHACLVDVSIVHYSTHLPEDLKNRW
jgi:hypothetical protein